MSEWKEYRLEELLDITSSKRIMRDEYTSNGIPFYRSKEIIELNSGNKISTELFISTKRFNDIKEKFGVPQEGDILLTSVGTLGVPYLVNETDHFYFKDGNLTWFKNFSHKINSKFLFYWFLSDIGKQSINYISIGSTQKALTIASLKKLTITLPPIEYQEKICSILSDIDTKITLNTQTNQTLEQIAQAIFKHWFIDFAPVHAKANALASGASPEQAELATMASLSGKTLAEITALQHTAPEAYHQLQQTAQAFPSEFVESEMGLVPKGWEYKFLNEVCKIAYGKKLPTKQLLDQGYPVFGGNGIIGYFDRYLYEQPQTLISCRGAASGKIMYSAPKSFITNNSLIIESNELLDYFYIYEYLKNKDITPYISGSAQPQITISSIEKIKILLPQEFILERYSSLVSNLYNKIYLNNKNNELLAKTRDQLLPKLLNGEVEL
ncbi:restriction endonuclease subunit S [Avibacterium paragallinarum]|uniref:restriction endonuclease subunit S n=3 Tax=Avibacterium paragallinarum TaxID=728 RepID=UPI0022854D27|nr:restriction endonuclease subunit S [Avibacterium paragallinarum]WAM58854.1 restriction endonuclease subunit S [Avibacterium paragallinarum]